MHFERDLLEKQPLLVENTGFTYRYGFQGQESDDEVKGAGNSVNYKYRMHDPRVGRFFAVDPLTTKYPYWTPYSFSGNRVINAVELEGLEPSDSYLMEGNKGLADENKKTGTWGTWDVEKNAAGDLSWVQKSILNKNGDVISNDPDSFHKQMETEKMISNTLHQSNKQLQQNSDQFSDFKPLSPGMTLNSSVEKSPQQKFEDDLWNNGSLADYVAYKLNQADARYEGPKGLNNFAKDGLLVVNTAGQIAFFIPGGQVAGTMMMGFADISETAIDINEIGLVNAASNAAVRWVTGKVGGKFIPSQFVGSQIYRVGYNGSVQVLEEMGENTAVDFLNSNR